MSDLPLLLLANVKSVSYLPAQWAQPKFLNNKYCCLPFSLTVCRCCNWFVIIVIVVVITTSTTTVIIVMMLMIVMFMIVVMIFASTAAMIFMAMLFFFFSLISLDTSVTITSGSISVQIFWMTGRRSSLKFPHTSFSLEMKDLHFQLLGSFSNLASILHHFGDAAEIF